MLHIPILRSGKPYESVDQVTLVHHATGEPVAEVSQANPGMVVRDVHRMNDAGGYGFGTLRTGQAVSLD